MRVSHLLKVTPIYYVYQAPESLTSLKIKFANNLIAGTHILTDNFFLYKKNWDSLHPRLNTHCKAWSYKKKEHKEVKAYRKPLYKEPKVNR